MTRTFALALLAAIVGTGAAHGAVTPRVAVGMFGGLSVPILQDVDVSSFSPSDAFGETGSRFGIRVPVKAIPIITFEPYFAASAYSDREETFNGITYTRDGYSGTTYGLNFVLGYPFAKGFKFYPYLGIGRADFERAGQAIDEATFNFGLGLAIPAAQKVSVHTRAEFDMVVTDDTSRKFANWTLGVHYTLQP